MDRLAELGKEIEEYLHHGDEFGWGNYYCEFDPKEATEWILDKIRSKGLAYLDEVEICPKCKGAKEYVLEKKYSHSKYMTGEPIWIHNGYTDPIKCECKHGVVRKGGKYE